MRQSGRTVCDMKATLPATLEAMEAFVAEFRLLCGYLRHEDIEFVAELLLREALVNALEHGCRGEADRSIRCRARWRGRRLTVAVADDGEGFDWRSARGCRPDPMASSGRGLEILQKCSSLVRFNNKGNAVTIVKRF